MKKLFSLVLALLLILTCAASAQTVRARVTVDREQAKALFSGFGMPEAQMATVDPILSLVNALGVRVTTAEDGAQVDLDLNGADAMSMGWTLDDADVNIVSTLFPNYYLTLSNETIAQIMAQMAQNMPGAGGEGGAGGFDMAAMQAVFGGYYQKWLAACTAAGVPGEPVEVKYEYKNYVFDTMVPVTVDMEAITEATTELVERIAGRSRRHEHAPGHGAGHGAERWRDVRSGELRGGLPGRFHGMDGPLPGRSEGRGLYQRRRRERLVLHERRILPRG